MSISSPLSKTYRTQEKALKVDASTRADRPRKSGADLNIARPSFDAPNLQQQSQQAKDTKLVDIFAKCLGEQFKTRLCGNADEPFYQAASSDDDWHIIYYRYDYAASALHELAHWCIAGTERRNQDDYGYWYLPDGRNVAQQLEFQQVEVKPQAIEMAFSKACSMPFRVSIDNLGLNGPESDGIKAQNEAAFTESVNKQYQHFCEFGFPPRAQILIEAFKHAFSAQSRKQSVT